jgi:hypothetical protein
LKESLIPWTNSSRQPHLQRQASLGCQWSVQQQDRRQSQLPAFCIIATHRHQSQEAETIALKCMITDIWHPYYRHSAFVITFHSDVTATYVLACWFSGLQ